jgi:hypothetical protein
MHKLSFLLIWLFVLCCSLYTHAQEKDDVKDTGLLLQPGMDTTGLSNQIDSIYIDEDILNRPKKATNFSTILPGLGQIYNKRYWKLPIIYGTLGTIGYFISYNNKKYQQYRNAYLLKKSFPEDFLEDKLAIEISEENLLRGVDYYRRNRDLLMILLVGFYGLQILDAHVDAHLMDFEINEDISLGVGPGVETQSLVSAQQYGLKLTLKFN